MDDRLALRRQATEAIIATGGSDTIGPAAMAARHDRRFRRCPHTDLINRAITNLLVQPGGALMINTPPRVGKSVLVSQWTPAWWLSYFPQSSNVIAAYGERLARKHSMAVRDIITRHGTPYGLALSKSQGEKSAWQITAGGGLIARGVGSGLTGEDMDGLGIIDDPTKNREDAESEAVKSNLWDWYSATYGSRIVPTTREIVVMTRWSPDDLAGRILDSQGRVEEGGRWTVIHLPAIALNPDPAKGIYPDPLGREPGEPLTFPTIDTSDREVLLAHWNTQRERSTGRDWNALYQGTPFDAEGALLTEDNISANTAPAPGIYRRKAIGVDPAGGGRDSVGISVAGLDPHGVLWWLEDHTRRMTATQWPRKVCELAARHRADRIVVETNYGGDLGTTAITQAWKELEREHAVTGLCPLVVAVTARKSKVLRAEPIAQAILTGRAKFAAHAPLHQLTTEWQMWTPGSTWSPGALDAAVHVATDLLPAIPRGSRYTNPAHMRR